MQDLSILHTDNQLKLVLGWICLTKMETTSQLWGANPFPHRAGSKIWSTSVLVIKMSFRGEQHIRYWLPVPLSGGVSSVERAEVGFRMTNFENCQVGNKGCFHLRNLKCTEIKKIILGTLIEIEEGTS